MDGQVPQLGREISYHGDIRVIRVSYAGPGTHRLH